MATKPTSVKEYLDALPADRRSALATVRATIRKNLPAGYAEGIQYGMIGYFVPHRRYPAGYHCDPKEPLPFASIASQKNHMAIYLFCIYMDPAAKAAFAKAWKDAGCRLDMGASCFRFKKIDDVPLDVLGAAIKAIPLKKFVATYEANLPASVRKKRPPKVGSRG